MTDTPRICAAPGCGEFVQRRPGEKPSKWRERKTCSEPCRRKASKLHHAQAIAVRRPDGSRPCAVCGEAMNRGYHEGYARFMARKTCSNECKGKLVTLMAGGTVDTARSVKLPGERKAMGRPTTALNRCTGCGETIPKPDGMTWAKYRGRSTCGSEACKTATSRKAVGAPQDRGMSNLRAELMLTVTPRQIAAYRNAPECERHLFAPAVRAVAEARRAA